MLIAFLQQLVTFRGFYDSSLEFLRLEGVQVVASMNPATTVGRHPLSTRSLAASCNELLLPQSPVPYKRFIILACTR